MIRDTGRRALQSQIYWPSMLSSGHLSSRGQKAEKNTAVFVNATWCVIKKEESGQVDLVVERVR